MDYTMVAWRSAASDRYSSSCQPSWSATVSKQEYHAMKTWRKPKTTEIAVGTEINAYACAGL
ncbi:pyrroloquinoline quinone precursor peptide PqqA [Azospirillum sp. TSA2s]|uniref:pyrroloquinoline quinone precursor peptide PqqA n=1 Tax=Azospirillum sp. TSA2s TaxID=709810 RepID=UPI001FFF86FB|nr:pyrroloquinoline quinone precursor peptide PqqA [Azospirillum sp. TSA2s]